MVDLWLPQGLTVRHDIGNHGAMNGGPARVVHHTTSNTSDHNWSNEWHYFAGGGAAEAPHLVADPFTGEVAQLLPADSRAMALRNDGSILTNRTGRYCIQIEWVFTEGETYNGRRYDSLAQTPLKPWPQIHAWLKSLGIVDEWPGGAPRAWARQTVSESTWQSRGGHYGHCHVPGNTHVDPGPMPNLFPAAPPPPPPVSSAAAFFMLNPAT